MVPGVPGVTLMRRVGNPNIHMVLEYAVATGVVAPGQGGRPKYRQMLLDAFAEHLLSVKLWSRTGSSRRRWICRCCAWASMCPRR